MKEDYPARDSARRPIGGSLIPATGPSSVHVCTCFTALPGADNLEIRYMYVPDHASFTSRHHHSPTHSLTHSTTLTPYNGRFPRKWRQPRQRAPRSSATIPQRDRICEAARRSRARREIARETAHPSIHPSTFHTHKQRNRTTNTDMKDGFRHTTATAIWCSGM